MPTEHQPVEPDQEEHEWLWLAPGTNPGYSLDFDKLQEHYALWLQVRAEWKEREAAGTLDADARHALIERLAESLPGEYTGPFEAVSGVVVGVIERLLRENLDYHPLLDLVQLNYALQWTAERLRRLDITLCYEADPENLMSSEDEAVPVYSNLTLSYAMDDEDDEDEVLTIKDAARELNISTPAMHNHIQRKRGTAAAVPVFRVRGKYVVYRRELEEWRRNHYEEKFAPKRRRGRPGKRQPKDAKRGDES